MQPKFTEGEIVKETLSQSLKCVKGIMVSGNNTFYSVVDVPRDTPYQGHDLLLEKHLESVEV